MDKKVLSFIWNQYSGRIMCTLLAIVAGCVYLACGFLKMVVFSIIISLGYFLGRYVDRQGNWKETIDKLLVNRWTDK